MTLPLGVKDIFNLLMIGMIGTNFFTQEKMELFKKLHLLLTVKFKVMKILMNLLITAQSSGMIKAINTYINGVENMLEKI